MVAGEYLGGIETMRSNRILTVRSLLLAIAFLPAFVWGQERQDPLRRPFLFKDSRGELALARAKGQTEVLLIIASAAGANAKVAKLITQWGGTVRYRADDVDYLRAKVPIDSVESLVRNSLVTTLEVNTPGSRRIFDHFDNTPSPSGSVAPRHPTMEFPALGAPQYSATQRAGGDTVPVWPPVLSDYPLSHPYSPLADMGAAEFRKSHPTWDGRGVVVAMIDMNPDVLLPELQTATSLDGKAIPKVRVYKTAIDGEEEETSRWLKMRDTVIARSGALEYKQKQYRAPRDGTFRIAIFDSLAYDRKLDKAVKPDSGAKNGGRYFAVLWNESTNDVWVDTNHDLSFADETALSDFSARPTFGVIGKDDPKTQERESIAFGIQVDRARKMVGINLGDAGHGTTVIGAAIASKGSTGRIDGVAPGAQLASVSEGTASYGQVEAVIEAERDSAIDVIFLEHSRIVSESYLPKDGRLVPSVIFARLIEKYRKPIVSPTHNYPQLGGVSDYTVVRGVLGIGAHESKANFLTNHGVRVQYDDNLHITGGYGPAGNGALKPDVLAPSHIITTKVGFEAGASIAGLFALPPGYAIGGGTSTATPVAAGAVALLISAAKQTGLSIDPYKLHRAVTMSARYVPNLPAYKQGNGVINVAAAWELLNTLDTLSKPIVITSRAPVRHASSANLFVPHEGVGLFEREGWKVGDRGERTITFTRKTGPPGPMTFSASWLGNGGTFSGPQSITLPLNTPVSVAITIAPTTVGVHSAILTLDHPSVPGHAHRVQATIVAPEQIDASRKFVVETKVNVERPGINSWFYYVPPGVHSLKVDLAVPTGNIRISVLQPDLRYTLGWKERQGPPVVLYDPMPGVWEVRLSNTSDAFNSFDWQQALKNQPLPATPATLTVAAVAIDAKPSGGDVPAASPTDAMSTTVTVSLRNRMGAFSGTAAGMDVGSARYEKPTIRDKEQHMYELEVPKGSTMLLARALRPSDPQADLDIYIYDCTGDECTAARSDADPQGEESIIVNNPKPGKWRIVVDGFRVTAGTTSYEYFDVVFNPSYGHVSVIDSPDQRATDANWNVRVHRWLADPTPQGRTPLAVFRIDARNGSDGDALRLNFIDITTGQSIGLRGNR
jgi:hypothetical protein